MEPLIIDTIIEKVDSGAARLDEQEKIIAEISQKILVTTEQAEAIKDVAEAIEILRKNINSIHWPLKEMTEMRNRLAENNELLSNPRKTKQVIFHTAGRLIWVVIGMFLGMVFLTMGWVNTSNKLDQFRMHDVMWRYIKQTNQTQNLEYLQGIEEMYLNDPNKMKSFVEKGELRLKQMEDSNPKSIKNYPTDPERVSDAIIRLSRKKRLKSKNDIK
jgi:hypothetical protein